MADFLRRFFLDNLALKLIALLSAVLLWSAVSHEPVIEVLFTVPLEFHHVPESLELASEDVPQAQIRLRGPARRLRDLSAADVRPVLDLSGARPGERTFDIGENEVKVPRGIEVVQVMPSRLRLVFDRRMVREVPVNPRVVGSFPAGYGLAKITADPQRIAVVGPEKRVNALDAAMTDPVDASGVIGTQTFTTNAYVGDSLVREVRHVPIRVTVTTERQTPRGPAR